MPNEICSLSLLFAVRVSVYPTILIYFERYKIELFCLFSNSSNTVQFIVISKAELHESPALVTKGRNPGEHTVNLGLVSSKYKSPHWTYIPVPQNSKIRICL